MNPVVQARPPDTPVFARYNVLGSAIDVAVSDAAAHMLVERMLSYFPAEEARVPATRYSLTHLDEVGWLLREDNTLLRTDQDLPTALLALEWHIMSTAIARRRDLFHLHGAALVTPDGTGTILLVGASGSGKTTLALGLLACGFLPCGDDVILIEPTTGTLHALRRAFHVREPTPTLIRALNPPDTWALATEPVGFFLPPQWADSAPPVRAIFFPHVRREESPALVPLVPPEAAQALLTQTVTLDHSPAVALAVAAGLIARAACYRLTMNNLAETIALVRAAVAIEQRSDAHGR